MQEKMRVTLLSLFRCTSPPRAARTVSGLPSPSAKAEQQNQRPSGGATGDSDRAAEQSRPYP